MEMIIYGIVLLVAGFVLGIFILKLLQKNKMSQFEILSNKIVEEAKKEAENIKKSAILESKEQWLQNKTNFDRKTSSTRKELDKRTNELTIRQNKANEQEKKLRKKEKTLNRSTNDLNQKVKSIKIKENRLKELLEEQNILLEKIANMTQEEAKQILIKNMENDAKVEAVQVTKKIIDDAKRKSSKEAKNIIISAIQKCAADHTSEVTISTVSLPSDEMKGRIIGREGRNIRSFENATGIDVIIDDTPEAVVLSGFDPVRREIARLSLEKLIGDGRIHPGRIEEVVAKTQSEMSEHIIELGENAAQDCNVYNLPEELIKHLGRLHFRTSYGQNVLQHSKEVAWISGMMAGELELDIHLARRAGLLHDIGKSVDQQMEGTHTVIGHNIVKKYNEKEEVLNAILSHHEDVEPTSAISILVAAGDAVSGSRPGARKETLESYINRIEKLEDIAVSFEGVDKSYAIQAGREIRVIVESKKVNDSQAENLSENIAKMIEKELDYPGQIKVTVIREVRNIAFAK